MSALANSDPDSSDLQRTDFGCNAKSSIDA